jgi:tetratricopeptide (TPR) repeat protein
MSFMRARWMWFFLGAFLMSVILFGIYQIPPIKFQLEWRIDAMVGIVRSWLYPGDVLPTPGVTNASLAVPTSQASQTTEPTATSAAALPTAIPTMTPTPIPGHVRLEAPRWEKQDWNNCGPATLALNLRYFGWEGDQFDISSMVKPDRGDKNVNIDELIYFVHNHAGWLEAQYRVGGTLEILQRFIAAGYPVIVEKGYVIESDGPDAGWAGHYLMLTGYDLERSIFISQDSFIGPDEEISFETLEAGWEAFNWVYMVIYPVAAPPPLESILGPDFDLDANRQRTMERARQVIETDPENAYAWFNLGTNLLYFERYRQAAEAFDNALSLGLPWRFTRYQFGPYIAYFHAGRTDDLLNLAEATLQRTAKAEESLLWRGWGRYRMGDLNDAIQDFRAALQINPNYIDAQYALEFLGLGG